MYSKKQRIIAAAGVILIILLLIGLILSAVFDAGGMLFKAFLFASVAMPILLWIYIWLFGKLTGKKTIADFDLGKTGPEPLSEDAPENTGSSALQTAEGKQSSNFSDEAGSTLTVSKNPFLKK